MSFQKEMRQKLTERRIIAVVVIEDWQKARPLAEALLTGGINAVELTLRTPAAAAALEAMTTAFPQMYIGAGTVLTVDELKLARDSGACFAVAPGLNRSVVEAAARLELPFAPGIVTPSDIEAALELDCSLLKFFPAEASGGLAYLRSMAAPYLHRDVTFVPLGGINTQNAAAYLSSPLITAIGGSWLVPQKDIDEEAWTTITERARHAAELSHQHRI